MKTDAEREAKQRLAGYLLSGRPSELRDADIGVALALIDRLTAEGEQLQARFAELERRLAEADRLTSPSEFFKSDEDLARAVLLDHNRDTGHGWLGVLTDAIQRAKRGEAPAPFPGSREIAEEIEGHTIDECAELLEMLSETTRRLDAHGSVDEAVAITRKGAKAIRVLQAALDTLAAEKDREIERLTKQAGAVLLAEGVLNEKRAERAEALLEKAMEGLEYVDEYSNDHHVVVKARAILSEITKDYPPTSDNPDNPNA